MDRFAAWKIQGIPLTTASEEEIEISIRKHKEWREAVNARDRAEWIAKAPERLAAAIERAKREQDREARRWLHLLPAAIRSRRAKKGWKTRRKNAA